MGTSYPVHWQLERLHNSPTKPRTSFNTFRSASILLPVLFCSILILSLYPSGYFWSSVLDTVKDNASLLKMERFRSDHALLKTAYKRHWNYVLGVWICIVKCWFQGRKWSQNVLLVHVIWPQRDGETKTLLQILKSNPAPMQWCSEAERWHQHAHKHTQVAVLVVCGCEMTQSLHADSEFKWCKQQVQTAELKWK